MGASAVYVMTNESNDNVVRVYRRNNNTGLIAKGPAHATGGDGNGARRPDPLQSQGSLALRHDGRYLFAVNAASDTVTSFSVDAAGDLSFVGEFGSGGRTPVSVVASKNVLYVLNQGVPGGPAGTVVGLQIGDAGEDAGKLTPLPGTPVDVGSGPAQVLVSPDGGTLLAMGLGSGTVHLLGIGPDGAPQPGTSTPVDGGPFGSVFAGSNTLTGSSLLAVTDPAVQGGVRAYQFADHKIEQLGGFLPTGNAACWAVVDDPAAPNVVFVANAGQQTISGFRPDPAGLTPLQSIAAAVDDGAPTEMAVSSDHRHLYVVVGLPPASPGAPPASEIRGYRIDPVNGTLTRLSPGHGVPLPASSQGIVAV